ncbi:Fic family protein [Specibacter cremeus]|uniref:Fic family protein n=1 Tax=Specibacter cremeus TaxID=1629051 RepID=UPI000F7A56DB|nr:Fic family protein [Specibacter cremeus]
MLRRESSASSQLENLTVSARSLGEAELGVTDRLNATIVVRNVRAMEAALAAADELSAERILDMHLALLGEFETATQVVGSWRREQVWIGTGSVSPLGATFVPPHHSRVPALVGDLVEYIRRGDIEPMIQASIAHAQLETIHPFTDGSGRTGRAPLQATLKHREITRHTRCRSLPGCWPISTPTTKP